MSSKENYKEYVKFQNIYTQERGASKLPFFSFQKFDKNFFFDYNNKQCVYKILYNNYYEKWGRQYDR